MTGIDHQPLEIRLLYHRFQHFFPDALVSPATETPLDSIPLTIFRRQVSPWCSRSQNPEHAIQKLTGILCVPSPRSLVSYCVRLENFPHRIGHIVPSIAVLHEVTPLCVFLHYTTKRHFCRQCLAKDRENLTLFERLLQEYGILYHRIRPATPRHNGKVERGNRTDELRFYSKLRMFSLQDGQKQLAVYQHKSNNIIITCLKMRSPNDVVADYLALL